MTEAMVQTVLGPVAARDLGRVDCHEHLVIAGGPACVADPDLRLDDEDEAVFECEAFGRAGGATIVDALPTGCGRDVEMLVRIAQRSGLHLVATSGFHRATFYGDLHWARRYPASVLGQLLIEEVTSGIDRWDYCGPRVERTVVRPGLLKLATGFNQISSQEEVWIRAVADAHVATAVPILTHTERGTHANEQLDHLEGLGVDPRNVAISHLDRNPDLALHRSVVARGAFVICDGLGRENYRPFSAVAAVLSSLVDEGFGQQIMLGADIGRRSMRRAAGGLGAAGLMTSMVPALLRAGVSQDSVDQMLIDNPRRFLGGQS